MHGHAGVSNVLHVVFMMCCTQGYPWAEHTTAKHVEQCQSVQYNSECLLSRVMLTQRSRLDLHPSQTQVPPRLLHHTILAGTQLYLTIDAVFAIKPH